MKITAAVATEPKTPFDVVELDLDDPRPDEVQIRLVATGVCRTDAIVRDQWYPTPLPAVLGHEGAGVVEKVGSAVSSVRPGDHVVLSFNSCGACKLCLTGHPAYCENFYAHNFAGQRSDGTTALSLNGRQFSSHFFGQSSFASHANVAERSVVRVPEDAPLEILGPLGCGIQTGAGAILNVLQPRPGSAVVVFGAGAVGLSAVLAAKLRNATTIDIGTQLLSGQKISLVIEGDSMPQVFIPELIHLHQAGLFPFDRLIKSYPLEQINQAFDDSHSGGTLKPVVVF